MVNEKKTFVSYHSYHAFKIHFQYHPRTWMRNINVKRLLKYYTKWPSDRALSSPEQFPYSCWYAHERIRQKKRERWVYKLFWLKTPKVETCWHTSPACYLGASTSGQRDIEVLLNPLSSATTCELWLAAGVLWHYCKSNVPLKWQFSKLLMKCIANMLVSGWLGKLAAAYFLYCHICQGAERIRSSFHGKLFKCNVQPVSHLVRTWGWWGQSFREILWGCFFEKLSCHHYPKTIRPLKCSFSC